MLQVEFRAMGCAMAAFLDDERPQAEQALAQVPAWFEEWEQALSRFRPDSELSRLNASAGAPFAAGPVLFAVTQAALAAARFTGGLVNPTILPALERAGYTRSFDQMQSCQECAGEAAESSPPPAHPDGWLASRLGRAWYSRGSSSRSRFSGIRLDAARQIITLLPGVKLDLGGIAKGWAAQQAAQRLSPIGPALVDASGDLAISGSMANGRPWLVDVADPLQFQESLDLLALDGCGVATSGIDYRRWQKNGVWQHHIIDPRTGQPAETDLLSVTIIAPDVLQAEAAAKAVLIQGSQAGLRWLAARPRLSGLLALNDGRLLYSRWPRQDRLPRQVSFTSFPLSMK